MLRWQHRACADATFKPSWRDSGVLLNGELGAKAVLAVNTQQRAMDVESVCPSHLGTHSQDMR